MSTKHLLIPDTQVRPGVNTDHLEAMGNYIVAKKPDVIIMIGDWFDMHSLSTYDRGTKNAEGARVDLDIKAGHEAMDRMLGPVWEHNKKRSKNKKKQYKPRMVFTLGNHEHRIIRHVNAFPELEGFLSYDSLVLEAYGWEVYEYQEIVKIDGICYSHNFINPHSAMKSIVGGTMDTKLKNLGFSFTMGHQQNLQYGIHCLPNGDVRQGLVAGAFYSHDEGYMGVQGNQSHWRGAVMKHEVKDGHYDPCFLSIDYLLKRWI